MARGLYLRTGDVAHRLHVSPKTVARWAKEGKIPYMATLGGHRRYPADAVERLAQSLDGINFRVTG